MFSVSPQWACLNLQALWQTDQYWADKSDNDQSVYHFSDESVKNMCTHSATIIDKCSPHWSNKGQTAIGGVAARCIHHAQKHKSGERRLVLDTFVEVGNCCSRVLKWHPQWQALLMAYSVCGRRRGTYVCFHTWRLRQDPWLMWPKDNKTSERLNSLVITGLKWRSFSIAILSCIYNCTNRVWHKNNCQPALDGQLGSSLLSRKAPTDQLNCPLSSKVAKPCQTYMPNMDGLNKSSSVNLDRYLPL